MTLENWLGVIGTAAQVAVAGIATYLAYRANRLNKDALFMQRIVSELFELVTIARQVKALYFVLFDPFPDLLSKHQAREKWVQQREQSLLLEPLTEERVLRALHAAAHWGELDGMDRSVRIAEEMPASADAADVAVELRSHHAATVRERFQATRTS